MNTNISTNLRDIDYTHNITIISDKNISDLIEKWKSEVEQYLNNACEFITWSDEYNSLLKNNYDRFINTILTPSSRNKLLLIYVPEAFNITYSNFLCLIAESRRIKISIITRISQSDNDNEELKNALIGNSNSVLTYSK